MSLRLLEETAKISLTDSRSSVIALSKLYSLNDLRVVQTMVKGDLIVPQSDRIVTRSQSKKRTSHFPLAVRSSGF